MKKLNIEIRKMSRLLLGLSLMLLLTNCSNIDETIINEEEEEQAEVLLTDAWICDMQSFEEDDWRYELYLQENGDYVAVSETRLLKVSKDGMLNSITMLNFSDDNWGQIRIYNDKIYRFPRENDFQNFDPALPLKVQIYDFDFNLLSDNVLDSKGIIYDVEIESDNLFGMLVYNPDEYTMTLKKLDLTTGSVAEIVLSTNGTNPTNLHILENGDYFCTASSSSNNLRLLDNDLNLIWANEINAYTINDAQYIAGQGIYISGRGTFLGGIDGKNYVALLDMDGNEINSVSWEPGDRWGTYMHINQEKIFVLQTEPETGKNMLLINLDYDLNIDNTIEIPGNIVQSDIILNENGSFSFVYGIADDPNDPELFPGLFHTRIFKFDDSYALPTNVIVQ